MFQLPRCCSLAERLMGGWRSQLDIVDGCHCWVHHSIFSSVGTVLSCRHLGGFLHVPVLAPACRGVMWWPQAGGGLGQAVAEPVTISTRKQSMDGCSSSCAWGSPSSAGLNVTLQNTFTATKAADNGTCAVPSCSVPSTRLWDNPQDGIHAGCPCLSWAHQVLRRLPHQTRDKERLVG